MLKGKSRTKGFTLIELLVVVLIIGILASIAFPQYQKAVERSKAKQALTVLNAYYQAYQAYYMAEGTVPTRLDVLPVDLPWSGREGWASTNNTYGAVSNGEWGISLYDNVNGLTGVCVGRLQGAYEGSGFCKFRFSPKEEIKEDTLYCAEKKNGQGHIFQKNKGDYCQEILKGTFVGISTFNFFSLP